MSVWYHEHIMLEFNSESEMVIPRSLFNLTITVTLLHLGPLGMYWWYGAKVRMSLIELTISDSYFSFWAAIVADR